MTPRVLAFSFILLAATSCVTSNMAPMIDSLAKDTANVCIHIGASLYTPEVTVARVNMPGVAATCMTGAVSTMPTAGVGTAIVTFPGQVTVSPIAPK